MVKRLPAMQDPWVRSQGEKDPLEKEMATHSSILAWEIPWAEEPGGLQSTGLQKSRTRLSNFTYYVGGFTGGSAVNSPHAMQEMQV